jgi:hypothetical protein
VSSYVYVMQNTSEEAPAAPSTTAADRAAIVER